MEVLEIIHAKLNVARRVLKDLIANYEGMEDATRGDMARMILDEVASYLQIEENLLFPFMRRENRYVDFIDRIRPVHDQIEDVMEHMVMMHVDEPGGDFYNQLVRLDKALDLAVKTDGEITFPWARVNLKDEDQLYIATHLRNQMVQESLPSSGLTIY